MYFLQMDISSTGFAADEAISPWTKPYVATALSLGYISGYRQEAGVVFAPEDSISAMEAALMLDNIMGLTDAVAVWYSFDEILPAWAVQSAANVSACGILPDSTSLLDESISRAEAAEMICRAMETLENRG